MPRRTLHRRSNVSAPDARTAAKYLIRLSAKRLYQGPDGLPRITSPCLFGNDRPLELEVGCGSGEFLCSLARQDRETNFVGVEVRNMALNEAVAAAARDALDNIVFVRADVRMLYPLLVADSLRAVYLHYPDPIMRPKFEKRRVFTERFLDEMSAALTEAGRLSVITDLEPYFMEMLELAERDERWAKTHEARYLVGFEPETKSRFQRLWEGHGLPTLRFELTKRASPSGT
jgi:tRNA (guanine-N7-)-methyltransferase